MSPGGRLAWIAFLVAVLAILAHAPSISGGFVYDDHRFIEQNPAIRRIDPVAFFADATTASATEGIHPDIYRPLRTLWFSLEHAVFGTEPAGWHLVSVLLHAANAVLVFLLLATWLRGALGAAAAGAAVFAVHPVTSESVAWLSSQGDLLAMTFLLGALLVLRRPGLCATALGLVLFLLACFAKESALVLPALFLLQARLLRSRDQAGMGPPWGRLAGMVVLIGLYVAVRVAVVPTVRQIPYPGGFLGTLRGMLEGMTWYAGSIVVPHGFSFDLQYAPPLSFLEPRVVLGAGILASLLLAGVYGLRARRPALAFFALGFLACLVPVSNVIVPLKTFVADRFLYPGLPCVALGLGAGLQLLPAVLRTARPWAVAASVVLLGIVTLGRDGAYADEPTLWKAVRRDRPSNANAYQGIAYELARAARISDAERAFRTYIDFNPIDGKAWVKLGDLFHRAAASLDPTQAVARGSNMRLRKKQALFAEITAYREATRIWDTFGLEVGRGSPEMRRRLYVRWLAAADELGDVMEMKRVNDRRVREAQGFDPADLDAFWSRARWPFRATRFLLAARVFGKQVTRRPVPKEELARVLAARAAILRDVRLDPAQADERLQVPFARFVERQTVAADDAGLPVKAQDFAAAARLVQAIDDVAAALAIDQRGLRRFPRDPGLLRLKQGLLR